MSRSSDDLLLDEILRLERDLEELKAAQRLGGASVLGYRTRSDDEYDVHLNLAAGHNVKTLTFTNDHPQEGGQIQQLSMFFSFFSNVMETYVPMWANGSDVIPFAQKLPPTDEQSIWMFDFRNDSGGPTDIYLKLFFSGTDSGTWQLT